MASTDLRAAAQQALDALEGWENHDRWVWPESALEQAKRNTTESLAALRAALAEPVQEPVCRDDGMPTSADERYLRRLLAYRVAMPGAYYDDGEAHGAQHGIQIDFMREPVGHIDAKLRALNIARVELQRPAEPDTDCHAQGICQRSGYSLGQRKPVQEPLSDEELDRLWRQPMSADWEHREFARAIEAAHGIKEEK